LEEAITSKNILIASKLSKFCNTYITMGEGSQI